jgi:hypothetical protein
VEIAKQLRQQQSFEFSLNNNELEQHIIAVNGEIEESITRLKAYQNSLGFEEETAKLRHTLEKLHAKKQSLLSKRKELLLEDTSNRLRYEQSIAELLAKKEDLEASAFTKADFNTEVVNIEFQQDKCILYLRRLKEEEKEGDGNGRDEVDRN